MLEYTSQDNVDLTKRQALITMLPCFTQLTPAQSTELAAAMQVVHCTSSQQIVIENEPVDSIYIIIEGEAEVSHAEDSSKKIIQVPIAVLRTGECIGLNDTGFYSAYGVRTATVTAMTDMLLLQLKLPDLFLFLKKHHLETSMYTATSQLLRMQLIKQSLPFTKLTSERLHWLAARVEETKVSAGTIIFNQGEMGTQCYLIRSGQVEILVRDEQEKMRRLAVLNAPALFGEATLITHAPRNATARTVEDCELLVLRHEYLSELIETEANVSKMFMTLMVDRSRPLQNPHIILNQHIAADGQEVTILKNPDNRSYFEISKEGLYIWQKLDGHHTLRSITLDLAKHFDIFAPDMVVALIAKLTQSGFISNLRFSGNAPTSPGPLWVKAIIKSRRILEKQIMFGNVDKIITKIYAKYFHYFFSKPAQFFFISICVFGWCCIRNEYAHGFNIFQ